VRALPVQNIGNGGHVGRGGTLQDLKRKARWGRVYSKSGIQVRCQKVGVEGKVMGGVSFCDPV